MNPGMVDESSYHYQSPVAARRPGLHSLIKCGKFQPLTIGHPHANYYTRHPGINKSFNVYLLTGNIVPRAGSEPTLTFWVSVLPLHHVGSMI